MRFVLLLLLVFAMRTEVFAQDSTYIYAELGFSLRSGEGLTLQESFPKESTEYPGTSYFYVEGKEANEDYIAEIRLIDCRTYLDNKSSASYDSLWKVYELNASKSRYPFPDTTTRFNGLNSLQGGGKTVSGISHGNKKVAYKYVDFMHQGIIYSIAIFDRKKILNASFENFLQRFQLI